MTNPGRLDPLSFSGCFAYLASDVPPGVMLSAWRTQRGRGRLGAGAGRAPQGRTLRAQEDAAATQRARA